MATFCMAGGPKHLQVVDPPSRKLKHQHVNMEPPKKTPGKGGSSLKPSWASGSICQSLGGVHLGIRFRGHEIYKEYIETLGACFKGQLGSIG